MHRVYCQQHTTYFAQGALVAAPSSAPAARSDKGFAQGALVGAIGPGGNLDVSGRDVRGALVDVAHGAAVPVGIPVPGVVLGSRAGPGRCVGCD